MNLVLKYDNISFYFLYKYTSSKFVIYIVLAEQVILLSWRGLQTKTQKQNLPYDTLRISVTESVLLLHPVCFYLLRYRHERFSPHRSKLQPSLLSLRFAN